MNNNMNIVLDLCARSDEEEWFEFKENWYDPKQLGEYISALSNAAAVCGKDNAYFVWGISDIDHSVKGTNFTYHCDYRDEPLQNYLARNLKPSVAFVFEELVIDGKRVVLLTIPAAKRVPTSFCRERYFRIGSSKVNLENYPEREAMVWKVLSEGYPTMINTESPVQDLTFTQLRNYYLSGNLPFSEHFETDMRLKTASDKYNMLACFLADNGNIPARVSIFSGTDKSSRLFSVKEFGNESLISTIDKIITFSESINLSRAIEHLHNGYREDVPLFDQECFNEALKNAYIHNDWTHRASPMVTFFEDRVEIVSFSNLAPNQTIEGFFRGDSKPVNEDLSVIFLATHLSERTGKGVPLIVSRFGREAFDIRESSIKVTIPYNWKYRFASEEVEKPEEKQKRKLSKSENRVLNMIIRNPSISQPVIAKELGIGKTTVQNSVSELKKKGIIERVGSNKTGHWNVKK